MALAFTALLFAGLHAAGASSAWFGVIFLPAVTAAISLIQSATRFCVYFGLAALFNFGQRGEAVRVSSEAARTKDRARSIRLIGIAVAAATGFTALAVLSAVVA